MGMVLSFLVFLALALIVSLFKNFSIKLVWIGYVNLSRIK